MYPECNFHIQLVGILVTRFWCSEASFHSEYKVKFVRAVMSENVSYCKDLVKCTYGFMVGVKINLVSTLTLNGTLPDIICIKTHICNVN